MTQKQARIIEAISAVNGSSLSEDGARTISQLLDLMGRLSQAQREAAFQVLCDYYCPNCGVEQPLGDCQCIDEAIQ